MSSSSIDKDDIAVARMRQRTLLDLDDPAVESTAENGSPPARKPRSQKKPAFDGASAPKQAALLAWLQDELARTEVRLTAIESLLREIYDKVVNGAMVKEYYTTQEAAKILQRRPYTVREWCRLGRVNGEKSHCGRGLDEEWRISHAELVRIQNEGLLPIQQFAEIEPPRRLGS